MPSKKKGLAGRGNKKPSETMQLVPDDDYDPTANPWPAMTPMVPTGAVDVDESIQLPTGAPHTNGNHHGQDHLPPISQHHHHKTNNNSQNDHYPDHSSRLSVGHQHSHHHHHSGHSSLPPMNHVHHEHEPLEHHHGGHQHHHEHQPSEHHHGGHQHHHGGHQHHQQQHDHHSHIHRVLETHDPRWWYLPAGSVHAPKYGGHLNIIIYNRNGMNHNGDITKF
ncbi:hypothetical protein I4U23_021169 [Adineta vaga]|nr:hypothetical protein I4U23_021169 [Adineta vaga]